MVEIDTQTDKARLLVYVAQLSELGASAALEKLLGGTTAGFTPLTDPSPRFDSYQRTDGISSSTASDPSAQKAAARAKRIAENGLKSTQIQHQP